MLVRCEGEADGYGVRGLEFEGRLFMQTGLKANSASRKKNMILPKFEEAIQLFSKMFIFV